MAELTRMEFNESKELATTVGRPSGRVPNPEPVLRDLEDGLGVPYSQLKIISPPEWAARESKPSFLGRDIPKALVRIESWVPGQARARFKNLEEYSSARLRINFIPIPREGRVELVLNVVEGPHPHPEAPTYVRETGSVEVTRVDGKLLYPWRVESLMRFALAQAEASLLEIMARRLRREAEIVWAAREGGGK